VLDYYICHKNLAFTRCRISLPKLFGLCLPEGNDVMSRAGELWTALSAIQNHVIILDDLWNDFHPKKGISRRTNVID